VKESRQFIDKAPGVKPHASALVRIEQNERRRQVEMRPKDIRPIDKVEPIYRGKPGPGEKIEPPRPPIGGQAGRDLPRPKEIQPIQPTPAKEGIKERPIIRPPKPKLEPQDAKGSRDRIPDQGLKPDKSDRPKEGKPEKVRKEPPIPMDRPERQIEERPRMKPAQPGKEEIDRPRELAPPREKDQDIPKAQPGKGKSFQMENPGYPGRPGEGVSERPSGKQPSHDQSPPRQKRGE